MRKLTLSILNMIQMTIGRERETDKPRLAVDVNGKVTYFGKAGSVPLSVSRGHCIVTIDDDMHISIEDITDNNFLFVNGVEAKKRSRLCIHDTIELGPDKYRLDVDSILKAINIETVWHIAHLGIIYEDYQANKLAKQVKQARFNALSTLPGLLSTVSIGLSFAIEGAREVLIALAAVFAIAFFIIRFKNAGADPTESKEREDEFREKYVCPNPSCGRFLGATPYKELLKSRSCPYCKAKYTE